MVGASEQLVDEPEYPFLVVAVQRVDAALGRERDLRVDLRVRVHDSVASVSLGDALQFAHDALGCVRPVVDDDAPVLLSMDGLPGRQVWVR